MDLEEVLAKLERTIASLDPARKDVRSGSRYLGRGASESLVEHVAGGGSVGGDYSGVSRRLYEGSEQRTVGLAGVMTKALAEGTGSSGGYLVPVETSTEIVRLIRARSAVMALGPRIVPVKQELDVTSLASGASAYYVAENAAIPVSEQTFGQTALLRPKELAALVPISNRLLRDAADSPDVEQVLREDLSEVLALRSDLAFLRGSGSSGEPLGIRNTSGLTPSPSLGANGRTPTFDDLKDMVAALRDANAPFLRPGWVFNPRTINTLEKIKDATGRYLADAGLLTFDTSGGGGTLLGYPFRTTTQIPTNLTSGTSVDTSELYFSSDWQEAWIGENEALTIEASDTATYTTDGTTWISAWQNRQHVFRAVMTHDFALRRPQLFSVMLGARP